MLYDRQLTISAAGDRWVVQRCRIPRCRILHEKLNMEVFS
jgi:hypothetical protein